MKASFNECFYFRCGMMILIRVWFIISMVKRRTISKQYLVLMLEGTVGGIYTYYKENDTYRY
jgi:disulfide bond formation protein DsbB